MKKIVIAGLGEFGSSLVSWILSGKMDPQILCCVEPDRSKHRSDLACYAGWADVPASLRKEIGAVVDCAAKGCGPSNLRLYQQLGLPAVFQNGEAIELCDLFHRSRVFTSQPRYLKITRCSALMSCAAAIPLMEIARIESLWGCFFKVNNRDCMLDMDYTSGREITILTGIPSRTDVVYLRGKSDGYAYHGTLHLECPNPPSRQEVLEVLAKSPGTAVVGQGIDTLACQRGVQTLVIEEGVQVYGATIRLMLLAFTPEINFPQVEAAINLLAA